MPVKGWEPKSERLNWDELEHCGRVVEKVRLEMDEGVSVGVDLEIE
jgi:hypothetical protein